MKVAARLHLARVATLGLVGTACSSSTQYPTSTSPADATRHPPAISLTPRFALPRGDEGTGQVRVLTPPIDSRKAQRTVSTFLDAVVNEDAGAVTKFFAPGAQQQLGDSGETRAAVDYWQRRLARLDYGALRGEALFRASETRLIRPDQASSVSAALRLEPRQIALQVPLVTTHVGSTRVFGPELTFVLQEDGDALTLARVIEDFQFL